ncbi:MAG: cysteine desulfurase [Bacteroidetes bacterium]|nr:cysteine desulfurase [Bacteroidota bacterium]
MRCNVSKLGCRSFEHVITRIKYTYCFSFYLCKKYILEPSTSTKPAPANIAQLRNDFPILNQTIYNKRKLVYLDNAATSQKPQAVIDAISKYYQLYNANVHRGVHYLSQQASQAYDDVRKSLSQFINARGEEEIVFTSGTTHSINLVAFTWGRKNVQAGDEIILSAMEHHSNIVPWQMLCEEKGARLQIIPMNDKGELLVEQLPSLINDKTKLIACVYMSNSLGTINPVREIIEMAHARQIPVMLDGAQAISHFEIDVQQLDCDFFVCSAHKMLGPTGTGFLYAKREILEQMPPYMGGGDMIRNVSFEKTTYNDIPFRFEAGTPNVEGVIGFGAAIEYWNQLNRKAVAAYEQELVDYCTKALSQIPQVRLYGTAANKASVISFTIQNVNALDAGMYLDTLGIAVRTGQHCTEPVMHFFDIPGTIRASFYFYNNKEDCDTFIEGVSKAIRLLGK